jgi:Cu(I)/Ag(I) efflux system membrane protein CusA/SilA
MIGGVITSAILELLIYPVIFAMWKEKSLSRS